MFQHLKSIPDDICNVCLASLQLARDVLRDPSVEKTVKESFENICSYLPAIFFSKCLAYIDQVGPSYYTELINLLEPKSACDRIHLCHNSSQKEIKKFKVIKLNFTYNIDHVSVLRNLMFLCYWFYISNQKMSVSWFRFILIVFCNVSCYQKSVTNFLEERAMFRYWSVLCFTRSIATKKRIMIHVKIVGLRKVANLFEVSELKGTLMKEDNLSYFSRC